MDSPPSHQQATSRPVAVAGSLLLMNCPHLDNRVIVCLPRPPSEGDTHLGRTNPRTQFNAHFSRPPLLVDSSTASVWTGIVRESDFRPHALEPLRQATTLHDSRRLTPPVLFQSRCLFIPAIATSGATREQTV